MRVLGIDPGFGLCGFAVISCQKGELKLESFGVIKTEKGIDFSLRLRELGDDFQKLLKKHKPDVLSIEDLFFVQNITTGIRVTQVRGVLIFLAQKYGCQILEPRPTELKRSFTGNGKAEKQDVKKMAKMMFHLERNPQLDDAADAIAAAHFACLQKPLLIKRKA